ncbi:12234_t:CDS:2 [Gigaspora rosea]|nr:12234_t:CDS:2 [Gigaspora rosea]
MTWLDEVEKAFATNLINDNRKIAVIQNRSFRPNFINQFWTPTLEGKWFAQLATRKQQVEEDIDAYHTAIQELLRRVESGGHQYPDTAKAQIFLNGVKPEIVLAVAPSTPNTLQAAYERAKAYESACQQNLSEDKVRIDPCDYLSQENLGGKSEPIPDLFDYYHGKKENRTRHNNQPRELLEQHAALFAWEDAIAPSQCTTKQINDLKYQTRYYIIIEDCLYRKNRHDPSRPSRVLKEGETKAILFS